MGTRKRNVKYEDPGDNNVDNDLTEFERERLKIIEERKKFLESLNFDEAKRELDEVAIRKPIKREKVPGEPPKKRIVKIDWSTLPRREPSLRLKNKPPVSLSEEQLREAAEKEEEPAPDTRILGSEKMKLEEEQDIDLTEVLKKFRLGLVDEKFNPSVDLSTCDLDTFNKSLLCFRFQGEEPTRVTGRRIQSLCLHPTMTKRLVIAGSTSGSLGIWDAGNGIEEGADVLELHPHRAPTNRVSVSSTDPCKVFTTSHDGTVLAADIEKGSFTNLFYRDMDSFSGPTHLTWHEEVDEGRCLLVGAGSGHVLTIDPRTPGAKPMAETQVFPRSVRTVHVHPLNPDYYLSASGTGGCVVMDRRWSGWKKSGLALLEMDHEKGLTSAFFSGKGNLALTTSNDDRLRVFDLHNLSGAKPTVKSTTVHNNHTGRWLSVFKAQWWPGREDAYVIGSLLRPRRIEIFESGEKKSRLMGNLIDEECLTTAVPVIAIHPTLPLVAGGNSTGKVHIFAPP